MTREPRNEAALASWEGEGGSLRSRPPHRLDERLAWRLDEDLSYLGVAWLTIAEPGIEHPQCGWTSYSDADKQLRSCWTFDAILPLQEMRNGLEGS